MIRRSGELGLSSQEDRKEKKGFELCSNKGSSFAADKSRMDADGCRQHLVVMLVRGSALFMKKENTGCTRHNRADFLICPFLLLLLFAAEQALEPFCDCLRFDDVFEFTGDLVAVQDLVGVQVFVYDLVEFVSRPLFTGGYEALL